MKEGFIEDVTFDLFSVELAIVDVAILSMIQDKLLPDAPEDGKTYGRNNAEWVEVTSGTFSHPSLTDKNAEPEFQHVTQEEKDLISATATIVSGHTEEINKLLPLIYAGL